MNGVLVLTSIYPRLYLLIMLQSFSMSQSILPVKRLQTYRDQMVFRFCNSSSELDFVNRKSKKYRGIFKVKSRVKIWQAREICFQQGAAQASPKKGDGTRCPKVHATPRVTQLFVTVEDKFRKLTRPFLFP